MNLSIGIFDLFTNAIPGSIYLVATIYVAVRLGWVDVDDLVGLDTTVALIGATLAAYLLGQIVAPTLRRLAERLHPWNAALDAQRDEFCRRNPTMVGRAFLDADVFTLLAGIRQVSPEAASEVDRPRAQGLMLRSASPAFLIGALIAVVEAIGQGRLVAVVAAAGLLALAALSMYEGHKRTRWAHIHTYECAAWLPDSGTRPGPPPGPA